MLETEIKIRISDPKAVRELLLARGMRLWRERHLETNTLYEDPMGLLRERHEALRVREAGKKGTLTFKGAPRKSRSFKVREEFETEVKNPKQLRRILRAVGYRPAFTYRKFRTLFRRPRLTVCLDETPAGNFLELEGERHEIVKLAKALGFSRKDFIKASYPDLIAVQDIKLE